MKFQLKISLLLKDGMGLRVKNFNMGVHWKMQFLGEGCMKNQYIGVEMSKKGVLESFVDLRGGLAKKKRLMILRWSWDPSAHYELEEPSYWHKYPKQITL